MGCHLYLSLMPESLVASMLGPEEFGAYLAAGTLKQPHGQAMFFQLKPGFQSDYFNLSNLDKQCVPHPDGRPKHSVYLAIYRVLERVPLEAIESLWLVTAHGRSLQLTQGKPPEDSSEKYHLYREICPVLPVIASMLGPVAFCRFVTDPAKAIYVPRICFVELALSGLAEDPLHGSAGDLPYHDVEHIRNCLDELQTKRTKTVDRVPRDTVLYRCVKSGFFVGDQKGVLYFPYPTRDQMETVYHAWWRCANDTEV